MIRVLLITLKAELSYNAAKKTCECCVKKFSAFVS